MRVSWVVFAAILCAAAAAWAQGAQIDLGASGYDSSEPVEVSADSLEVDQGNGSAVFTGNVTVAQGDLRLSAGTVNVTYADADGGGGRISSLQAAGGVTLATGAEAAEAREASYSINEGSVVMTGDVVLTQGQSALSGQRLVIDLASGTGRMEGQVRTIFQTGDN